MASMNLPGDWTVRGTVILAESKACYYGGDPSKGEMLRDVALMIMAGQTVSAHREDGYLVIVGKHMGQDRRACRLAARLMLASL